VDVKQKSSRWTPRSKNGRALQVEKKYPRVAGCNVPDVVKQKSALKLDLNWVSRCSVHDVVKQKNCFSVHLVFK